MYGMPVASMVIRVKVDRQGRMVLPKRLRSELGADPGEVTLTRVPEGVLLAPVTPAGSVEAGVDGLPVLRLGRVVTNEEVLDGIDGDRAGR
jgi:AbrB family looped-hinge helix DNA binding protein